MDLVTFTFLDSRGSFGLLKLMCGRHVTRTIGIRLIPLITINYTLQEVMGVTVLIIFYVRGS